MDKFHKYCLSVLLVIACSNVSAQLNTESIKSVDCKQFYEIYSRFLSHEFENSKEFCFNENSARNFAINQKQKALDLLGNFILEKRENSSYSQKIQSVLYHQDKHSKILENFEKQSRHKDFSENIYFKSKVAKIRNKDDLDLKNKA